MKKRLLAFSLFSIALFSVTFGSAFLTSVSRGAASFGNFLGAQVGVSVGVAPNEFTKIAQEVTLKQEELEARELAIIEREKALEKREEVASIFNIEWYVTIMAFILLLLILLNFYLDWRRDYYPRETT